MRQEIEIQLELRHRNVTRLFTYFHDQTRIYLVMEFAPEGDLYSLLLSKGPLEEARVARYVLQMAQGMHYIHQRGIIWRDCKPENTLLGLDGSVLLADFGFAVKSPKSRRRTICGTAVYFAPELLRSAESPSQISGVRCPTPPIPCSQPTGTPTALHPRIRPQCGHLGTGGGDVRTAHRAARV